MVQTVLASEASLGDRRVAVYQTGFADYPAADSADARRMTEAVGHCFALAGLDRKHLGTEKWNPLSDLLRPGDRVLLKPNLVKECHPRDPNGWEYVLTHGSVIWALTEWVFRGLNGDGTVVVADAPQTDSSFSAIVERLNLSHMVEHFRQRGLDLRVVDLRNAEWVEQGGVIIRRDRLPGDPEGCIAFNLGDASEFVGHGGAGHYYGADYDQSEVNRHHTGGRHEYLLCRTPLLADVIFSVPKLKTHKKAGITASLKNLIGINADKNWLPHHTESAPGVQGDERPRPSAEARVERGAAALLRNMALRYPGLGTTLYAIARRAGLRLLGDARSTIRSGNWWGNDTIWRTCLDLNKIALYGKADGAMSDPSVPVRRHYVLVDGIIGGEGFGPLDPDPVRAGLLIFGTNPPSVDAACAYLMAFDPSKIPIVRNAFMCRTYALARWDWDEVVLISNREDWNGPLAELMDRPTLRFAPPPGWKGHIEREQSIALS